MSLYLLKSHSSLFLFCPPVYKPAIPVDDMRLGILLSGRDKYARRKKYNPAKHAGKGYTTYFISQNEPYIKIIWHTFTFVFCLKMQKPQCLENRSWPVATDRKSAHAGISMFARDLLVHVRSDSSLIWRGTSLSSFSFSLGSSSLFRCTLIPLPGLAISAVR